MNLLQAACFFNAEDIVFWLRDHFEGDPDAKKELVNYCEPLGGNQAIHFAVINGNKKVIDALLNEFGANP
jgi:hypothetical protein